MEPIDKRLIGFCQEGNLDEVQKCVQEGADIHARNECALRRAAQHGHLDVVKYLVSLGANVHVNSESALQNAVANGHLNVVQYLVSLGPNMGNCDEFMLLIAAHHGHLDVVRYIITISASERFIKYTFDKGIILSGTGILTIQQEYDKIKTIKGKLSRMICIKQSEILLNINSFTQSY